MDNPESTSTPDRERSAEEARYADGRDGPEAAATEIVMILAGIPSLSLHEWVTGVIRRHLKERGARPHNAPGAATEGRPS